MEAGGYRGLLVNRIRETYKEEGLKLKILGTFTHAYKRGRRQQHSESARQSWGWDAGVTGKDEVRDTGEK